MARGVPDDLREVLGGGQPFTSEQEGQTARTEVTETKCRFETTEKSKQFRVYQWYIEAQLECGQLGRWQSTNVVWAESVSKTTEQGGSAPASAGHPALSALLPAGLSQWCDHSHYLVHRKQAQILHCKPISELPTSLFIIS